MLRRITSQELRTLNKEIIEESISKAESIQDLWNKLSLRSGESTKLYREILTERGFSLKELDTKSKNRANAKYASDHGIKIKRGLASYVRQNEEFLLTNLSKIFSTDSCLTEYQIRRLYYQKYELLTGKKRKCSCNQGEEWQGKKLRLHVDHRDGDKKNNTLENLRLLCPNCHSQTDTYCGRNIGVSARN